jgi:hypothetical protein
MARELVKSIKDISDVVTTTNSIISEATDQLNIVSKKGLLNVAQNFVPGSALIGGTTSRAGSEITALRTSITTSANNSKIMLDLILSGECHHDVVFFIQRIVGSTVTEIASSDPTSVGSRIYGFASARYDNDTSSTPSSLIFKFLDSPNVPSGTSVQYRIRFYGTSATYTFALNRTLNSTNAADYETVSSTFILSEYGL